MTRLLTIAVLSLMLPLRWKTSFVLLRPFEFLIALGLIAWPIIAVRRGVRVPPGVLLLLPYFLWYLISASAGGPTIVAREGVQVAVVTAFAFLVAQQIPWLNMKVLSRRLIWGMAAIAAGTIIWHISQGYLVGWKQLPDPRLTYIFLPPTVAALILFSKPEGRRRLWFVWAGMLPLVVMSGERKALIVYCILTVLLLARGRAALTAPIAAGVLVGLFALSTTVDNPYLQRQVHSIVDPESTGNYQYFLATGTYLPGDTPSNVSRAFAFHTSKQMVAQHPLFGVGTNQYVKVLDDTFPDLPDSLQVGIHGEFQRVLTENGLFGLSLYLGIWVIAWVRLSRLLRVAVSRRRLTRAQARILPLLLFIPFVLFLGTEAPGTRAFVGLIVISLLPDIVGGALGVERSPAAARLRSPLAVPSVSVPRTVP